MRLLIRLRLLAWVVIEDFGACDRCAQRLRQFTSGARLSRSRRRGRYALAYQPAAAPATAGHVRRPLGGYERGPPGMTMAARRRPLASTRRQRDRCARQPTTRGRKEQP